MTVMLTKKFLSSQLLTRPKRILMQYKDYQQAIFMDVLTIILYVAAISNMLKNPKTEW